MGHWKWLKTISLFAEQHDVIISDQLKIQFVIKVPQFDMSLAVLGLI